MRKLIFMAMSALLIISCSSNSNQETSDSSHEEASANHEDASVNEEASELQLNSGEKWAVNEEMKPHIEKGNEILNSYLEEKGTDYKELAESLKSQNGQLIKSCTMKGASHDELHKWLYPHIELIETLSKATDVKASETVVADLKTSFEMYQTYFQ